MCDTNSFTIDSTQYGSVLSYRYIYNHITMIIFLKENKVYQRIDVLQETFSHKLNSKLVQVHFIPQESVYT